VNYAHLDLDGWHLEAVDSTTYGDSTSIAPDGNGQPHISYYNGLTAGLKHAYRDGNGWHTEVVDAFVGAGQTSALALDSRGQPHITYWDGTNSDLKYAFSPNRDQFLYLPVVTRGG
jgi:hypothetical protein